MGIAHRRLSILDTRRVGQQPMKSPSGRTHIVYNGEFYGFKTERERLHAAGVEFRTKTDTEVILALYEQYGIHCLERIDGMFAFAIWDHAERTLILARDRLGIKPLFYAQTADGQLLFASEIKALLASGKVDDNIDIQAHHDYLGLNYVPGERTMLRGIKRLPPGHYLTWTDGRIRLTRYWSQTFHPDAQLKPKLSFNDAADHLRARFQTAVQKRLISDVPLGMFLSGGIDSSAVLMAMANVQSQPVKAFTIRFAENSYDESEFAQHAARHFGAEHHIETVSADLDTFLDPLTESMDEPYADSSMIPLWYLCRLARRHVTVALGGDGGDEVFAGYRTHYAWQLAKVWRALPRRLRENWAPRLVSTLPVSHKKVSLDLKVRAFIKAASHTPIDAHYGFKEFMSEDARTHLLSEKHTLEPTVRLFRSAVEHLDDPTRLHGILAADFSVYLPDDILVKVDRMSMLHGLEARVPFLDHDLVEWSAQLPEHYKLRALRTKAVLKRALHGRVPHRILYRKKAGFNVPMAEWLSGPIKPLMLDLLSPHSIRHLGLWSPDVIERMIKAHLNKDADHSRSLWALICFMLFNQKYRHGRSA